MPRQLARLDGQHLVKEPTEPDGTQRYSCETSAHPWPAEVLVRALRLASLTRKRSGVRVPQRPPCSRGSPRRRRVPYATPRCRIARTMTRSRDLDPSTV